MKTQAITIKKATAHTIRHTTHPPLLLGHTHLSLLFAGVGGGVERGGGFGGGNGTYHIA